MTSVGPTPSVAWDSEKSVPNKYVVYKRRWAMLLLFSVLSLANALLWITYSPISTLIIDYYGVDSTTVNSLSLVYMIVYIPLTQLSSWLIDVKGLGFGMMVGAIINCIGAWIRFTGSGKSLFPLQILGQT